MLREMQEIQALAIKYSKADLGRMVQLNLLDPQKAMMAGMMIQRIEQQNMKPPQTTAIQDVLGLPAVPNQPPQQPQPQMPPQGVAALPPQGAPSAGVAALPSGIKEMAGGGIVAFDEGGEVPGYAGNEGSVVTSSPVGRAFTDFFGGRQYDSDTQQQLNDLNQQFQSLDARRKALTGTFGFQQQTREQQAEAAQIKQQMDAIWQQSQALKSGKPATTTPAVPITDIPAPPAAAVPAPPAPPAPPAADKGAKGPAIGGRFSKLPGIEAPSTSISVPEIKGDFYDAPTPKALGEYGKERTDYLKSMGIDPKMYEKMIEGVEGKKGKLEKRKSEAKGEALMMAGLGLIGAREGQEFQTLSESGRAALSAYKQDVKELRAAEEKYDERIEALRIADQTAKQTGAEKDIARRDAAMDKVETAKMERSRAQTELNKTQATLQNSANVAGLQAKSQIFNTLVSAQTQREVAQLNADVQKWVHSRPPAEIQAIDIYAQRTGKKFEDAMKEFYAARQAPKQALTREDALKIVAQSMPMAKPEELNAAADRLMSGMGGMRTSSGATVSGW
jgi:hypothetical protein